jgi:hypothetical protein
MQTPEWITTGGRGRPCLEGTAHCGGAHCTLRQSLTSLQTPSKEADVQQFLIHGLPRIEGKQSLLGLNNTLRAPWDSLAIQIEHPISLLLIV